MQMQCKHWEVEAWVSRTLASRPTSSGAHILASGYREHLSLSDYLISTPAEKNIFEMIYSVEVSVRFLTNKISAELQEMLDATKSIDQHVNNASAIVRTMSFCRRDAYARRQFYSKSMIHIRLFPTARLYLHMIHNICIKCKLLGSGE